MILSIKILTSFLFLCLYESLAFAGATHFDWSRSFAGPASCYVMTDKGLIANKGKPVEDSKCSATHFDWSSSFAGPARCYVITDNGLIANNGRPVEDSKCKKDNPASISPAYVNSSKRSSIKEKVHDLSSEKKEVNQALSK